jgi:hypothetical protein
MTVSELFEAVEESPQGPVPWNTLPEEYGNGGTYVVSLSKDKDATCVIEARFTSSDEQERWLPNEPIIYIGQTSKQTIAKRVRQFYRHRYGDRSPHRGGQAVKLLLEPYTTPPFELWVYWAPSPDPLDLEHKMLSIFKQRVGRQPFANRT